MYKIFTLAAVISILPVSKESGQQSFNEKEPVYNFCFKTTTPVNPLEFTKQKPVEAPSADWMASAQENIRNSEYHFSWQEKQNSWSTPNRKNNFRFFYTEEGFTVEPRTTQIPLEIDDLFTTADKVTYKHLPDWKIKFNLNKKQIGKGSWKVAANKAEYITDKVTVQYINNDDGMRQNFIVHAPISKEGELKINFSVKTKLKIKSTGSRLQFFHKKAGNVLNYEQLKVWDATGKILDASLHKNNKNNYSIQVNDEGAVYPITIDPISTTPATTLESNQANAQLGFSVSSAGDVNGDGYSDVIAGAGSFDAGETDEGAAFVFHGSSTGVSITAAAILEGNQINARMGFSVSTAGDVNGDGFSDIIVGANLYDDTESNEGAAFVFHGSAAGINPVAAAMVQSNQAAAQMGYSVACAGDVNGDGYSDVIVGAWLYDNPEVNEGVAYIYYGSATGINTALSALLESNQAASNFGISVAGAGDVNGDGYSDVIVGAEDYDNIETDEGVVFVYHGSITGINVVPVVFVESNQTLCQFGFSVASAGDVNGDGYSDIIVGAYLFNNGQGGEGVAFIYHGSAGGINNTMAAILESNQLGANLGVSVACAGDINGDGYSDVLAGANNYDNVENNEGAVYVFMGSATGISTVPAAILETNQDNAQFGRSVSSAGDVNGDGYSDIIAGAPQYDNLLSNEGAAFIFHGSAAGISVAHSTATTCAQVNSSFGFAVASAGDINADGYSDVVVGAVLYDNGLADEGAVFIFHGTAAGLNPVIAATIAGNQVTARFGHAVASAGDVNGDGFSDIIVGATLFDNGTTDEGAAFVYHGSAAGIVTTAATTLDNGQANSNMGISVASAGDVNGDGYSDVIVGANQYDNELTDEGAAFVYHGSATGINPVAAAIREGDQLSARFGRSVSTAGDVNGDGFADVIIGSALFNNDQTDEGAAFIFHGSPTGIAATAASLLEVNQANAWFGLSVSAAGDVNGDGYADVIVGAPLYDNNETNEGLAYVFHGSATGIVTAAATVLEVNQANANFGGYVSAAGDVNGDGYADVVIGASLYDNGQTDEGVAFVYYGSVTGINAATSSILEINQAAAQMGTSVSGAGDINGDGYSDIVVGAPQYVNGGFLEGGAFVFQGNNPGISLRNNLRLYNTDLSTPINSSNFFSDNFGTGLFAKSFIGRQNGKLVWETRINYDAYSGTPITNSTVFTSQQSGYSDLGASGTELKNIINKILASGRYTKIRARLKYNPVTAITGQLYGPWRYVSSVIDGNSLGALPIELISFNAAWQQKGKTAKLNFVTDKESGICCFDIEKSSDGFNFTAIGTIPAKNTSGLQSYNFTDNQATGSKQFYRIKIKNITGQFNYSNMQELQHSGVKEIIVFPNPTTDLLQVQLNNSYSSMQVKIVNSAGQVVKQLKLNVVNSTIGIPVQNLAAGQYWLHLQNGNDMQVLQFVKQ